MKKNNDELMELLDSFDIDEDYNVLADKMDAFTKEKKKREQGKEELDAQPIEEETQKGPVSIGNTIIAPLKPGTTADAGGKTLIFSSNNPTTPSKAGGETVVMNENQIRSYIGEDDDPDEILRREVMDEFEGQPIISDKLKRILYMTAAVCVVFALLLGGYKVLSSYISFDKTSEVDKEKEAYFEEVKSWAESFNGMDDSQKSKIKQLESKFNKLSEEQKDEINEILLSKAGKTFDELLAEAKTEKTDDKKNNNTEIAEKKAEIKAQLKEAEAALNAAQAELDEVEATYNQAESDYNDAQALRDSGAKEQEDALAALNEIEKDALLPIDEFKEKYETNAAWNSAREAAKEVYQQKSLELNSLEINLNNAYYDYNVATEAYNRAKQNYNECANVYNDLVYQLKALE